MTDGDLYEVGRLLGEAILALFRVLAKLDGLAEREAIDSWVSTYVANRIIEGD